MISEIEDTKSLFWTEIFQGSIGYGLLFGYGLENSENFEKDQLDDFSIERQFSTPSDDSIRVRFESKVTLEDLPLPTFRVFSENDPQVEHYKQERERILSEYKTSDLRKLLIQAFE